MLTFHNLKKLNLYREQESTSAMSKPLGKVAAVANLPKSSTFRTVCKRLQLVSEGLRGKGVRVGGNLMETGGEFNGE